MSPLLTMVLAGVLVGAGMFLLVRDLVPGVPALDKALQRLNSEPLPAPVLGGDASLTQRVGALLARRLGSRTRLLTMASDADLAIVDKSRNDLLGQKALYAVAGFLFVPLMSVLLTVAGMPMGLALPGFLSLALAGSAWTYPDLVVRDQAAKARYEFASAATAYLDLVAIARTAGDAANEAMVRAAGLSGHPAFRRISEVLQHSTWAGTTPWDAVLELRTRLDVAELGDIADIMRLTGGGGQVIESLRQRARALRDNQLAIEQARAARRTERLTAAMSLTVMVFLLLLLYPASANIH